MTGRKLAAIAIGRNEGDRLVRCLESLRGRVDEIVYVDSGSIDGSLERARMAGAHHVVELDTSWPFTAARARNAGFEHLLTRRAPDFVQFVDGDCEVQPDWIDTAASFLVENPDVAVVCGRRRERRPDATLWNRLVDIEWDTPVGDALSCGGDAMIRADALEAVGGYDPRLIAGEEPELCVRLRRAGWRIVRLDAEMTRHDADMKRVSQWWQRSRRAGYAYAEGAAMHGAPPERHKVPETRRALIWGFAVPFLALAGLAATPWSLLVLLAFPVQILRLMARGYAPLHALFLTIGKVPEAVGVLEYWAKRAVGWQTRLIEYK